GRRFFSPQRTQRIQRKTIQKEFNHKGPRFVKLSQRRQSPPGGATSLCGADFLMFFLPVLSVRGGKRCQVSTRLTATRSSSPGAGAGWEAEVLLRAPKRKKRGSSFQELCSRNTASRSISGVMGCW